MRAKNGPRKPRRKEDTGKNNSAKPWLQSRRVCPTIFLGMATIDPASSGWTRWRTAGMGRANSQKPEKRLSLVDIPVLNWWRVRLRCLFSFFFFNLLFFFSPRQSVQDETFDMKWNDRLVGLAFFCCSRLRFFLLLLCAVSACGRIFSSAVAAKQKDATQRTWLSMAQGSRSSYSIGWGTRPSFARRTAQISGNFPAFSPIFMTINGVFF